MGESHAKCLEKRLAKAREKINARGIGSHFIGINKPF
jgi:hypothetical protein